MGGIFKSVGKLFGLDSSAQKRAAEAQAASIMRSAEWARAQSQRAAEQAAEQTRLAQERAQVAAKVQEQQAAARPEEVEVDVGPAMSEDTPQRRRRSYMAPSGPSGSLRI